MNEFPVNFYKSGRADTKPSWELVRQSADEPAEQTWEEKNPVSQMLLRDRHDGAQPLLGGSLVAKSGMREEIVPLVPAPK